jgi:polysaccharide export outer membrane protein
MCSVIIFGIKTPRIGFVPEWFDACFKSHEIPDSINSLQGIKCQNGVSAARFLFVFTRGLFQLVYFQEGTASDTIASHYTPVFETDDFLSIVITAEDAESAKVFNLPQQTTAVNNGYLTGNPVPYGYLVDASGQVHLPVLGKIKVVGKTRTEVVDTIESLLQEYLKSPTVQIQIQNFKVTVLGDVKNPGTFKIPNERITLIEAIGLAGDMRMSGVRNNVLVIRDSCGKKQEFRVDMTKKDFFSSPVYYLKQNDVVYIEPNAAARSEGTLWKTTGAIFISLTSLVITTIALITR